MAITITEQPFLFGWARNRARLKMNCTGILKTSGSRADYRFYFTALGAANTHVVLAIDGRELVYTITSGSDMYSVASITDLINKMASNVYVNRLFNTTANVVTNTLRLQGKENGRHVVEIYTTGVNGLRNGGENSLISNISPNDTGVDRANQDNYAVAASVEVTVNNFNSIELTNTEQMVFRPNADNVVCIPLDVIAGFIPQPDIPSSTNNAWQLLTNALLKFRVEYGEMWGSPTPLMQNSSKTDYFYALCGEMTERYAQVGLPDWKSGQNSQIMSGNDDIFWVIGQDTGEIQYVRQSQPEWIYGLFYRTNTPIGSDVPTNKRVTVAYTGVKMDGTSVSGSQTYTQKNGQVYRIDVSPSRMANSAMLWYTVTVSTSWGSWSRTYHVLPDNFEQNYILLQDKYGLLRVAVADKLDREVATEAEELVMDRRRYLNVTKRAETYTATLEGLTKEAASKIGRSVGNKFHYIKNNGKWERVVIEPNTYSVKSSATDLVSVELQLRFVEDQQENMSTASIEQANGMIFGDDNNEILSYEVITDPTINNIF